MGRLFLGANETYGSIGPYTSTDVIGTATGHEKVFVDIDGKASFDPSFNRGGDNIVIDGNSDFFSGVRSGSNLLITNTLGAQISIPVGSVGANVTFDNGTFLLIVSNGGIKIGDQSIGSTAALLDDVGTGIQPAAALQVEAPLSAGDVAVVPHDSVGESAATDTGLLFLEAGIEYGPPELPVITNMVLIG